MKSKYSLLLLDVEETLVYKKYLYETIHSILLDYNYAIPLEYLRKIHKLTFNTLRIPPQTSEKFYEQFNAAFLLNLGIIPEEKLMNDIYQKCRNLDWILHEDTSVLEELSINKAIVSNWKKNLKEFITSITKVEFSHIISSYDLKTQKPSKEFYLKALQQIAMPYDSILYVGDSLKLDILPATEIGIRSVLIDRHKDAEIYRGEKIISLRELKNYVS